MRHGKIMNRFRRCHPFWRFAMITAPVLALQLGLLFWARPGPASTLPVDELLALFPEIEIVPDADLTFPEINCFEAPLSPAERGYFARILVDQISERDGEPPSKGHHVLYTLMGNPGMFERILSLQMLPTEDLLRKEIPGGHPQLIGQRHLMTRPALLMLLVSAADEPEETLHVIQTRRVTPEPWRLMHKNVDDASPANVTGEADLHWRDIDLGRQRVRIGDATFQCAVYMSEGFIGYDIREWEIVWWAPGIGRVLRIIFKDGALYDRHLWRWRRVRSIVSFQLNEILLPQSGVYWRANQAELPER